LAGGSEREVPLRITLAAPPPDVVFCLQRGRSDLVSAVRSTGEPLSFDFEVRARDDGDGGAPRFLGEFTQGPPATRFVYVNSGTYAGDAASCWSRRAKVPLAGITRVLLRRALAAPGSVIEARIEGTARDGGPACATCRPLGKGWSVVRG
jgi:hypothetical protein